MAQNLKSAKVVETLVAEYKAQLAAGNHEQAAEIRYVLVHSLND